MKKEDLIALLSKFPDGTVVVVRHYENGFHELNSVEMRQAWRKSNYPTYTGPIECFQPDVWASPEEQEEFAWPGVRIPDVLVLE